MGPSRGQVGWYREPFVPIGINGFYLFYHLISKEHGWVYSYLLSGFQMKPKRVVPRKKSVPYTGAVFLFHDPFGRRWSVIYLNHGYRLFCSSLILRGFIPVWQEEVS